MKAFLRKIIEIIKWIMRMPGIFYEWMLSECLERQREDINDYELNDEIRRERQNSYGLSQIRNKNRVNQKYSLVPVQPKQQDDIYKDRAERFIDRLPHDIQERIMEKFGWLNDPVRIIEASHNKGYIPQEYVILFAADETMDLGEKICLLKQLFNIVKIEQDKIIERVDFLEAKVAELKVDNQVQSQKIDTLTAQNHEILQMLKSMQNDRLSFVSTQASSFVSYI